MNVDCGEVQNGRPSQPCVIVKSVGVHRVCIWHFPVYSFCVCYCAVLTTFKIATFPCLLLFTVFHSCLFSVFVYLFLRALFGEEEDDDDDLFAAAAKSSKSIKSARSSRASKLTAKPPHDHHDSDVGQYTSFIALLSHFLLLWLLTYKTSYWC